MVVVSSIHHSAVTNDYNDGANCLKAYLRYAETCSNGDTEATERVLRELAVWRDLEAPDEQTPGACVESIAAALTQRGYAVDIGVGMSHFRCDLAVRRHGELQYRLGILVDTDAHYEQDDLLERELMRPQLLRSFGWTIARVLTSDWRHDAGGVLNRLVRTIEQGEEASAPDVEDDDNEEEDAWTEFDGSEEPVDPVAPATQDVPARSPADAAQTSFTRRFDFVGGRSKKFWEVSLAGHEVTVRYGRIGSNGRTQTKLFADAATASRTAASLIRQKTAKGYQEKST